MSVISEVGIDTVILQNLTEIAFSKGPVQMTRQVHGLPDEDRCKPLGRSLWCATRPP